MCIAGEFEFDWEEFRTASSLNTLAIINPDLTASVLVRAWSYMPFLLSMVREW